MTPRGMIFTEQGLPVPKRNDINTWLFVDSMEQHGSLRLIKALRAENENLREGIQALKVANDELREANANQQIYILDLEKKIEVTDRLLDQVMARMPQS